ncbi:putative multicopper oxidase [Phytophthora cinnamomi]|uniref:putative multicopper oxidase n=1 Tax=Phytophthora cinnamomi TaxID=4785 RepID=UPI00355975B8|nr:putative multicopper oxidase [Phytophthora cinnamomi]
MRPAHFSAFAAALLATNLGSSAADVVTYDWRVTNITASYDGVSIQSLGINGKPSDQSVIDVELGQEVEVRVTNELNEPTCLHWHGLKQLGTQEMDGTSDLTQCHIDPNSTAVYRFTPDKAGTFWWHSHHIAQYAYGLRGPLVVHAPASEQQVWEKDIDGEFIIQMADLYHRPPQPVRMWDNILINNRGRYNCTAAAHHNFTECTDEQPLSHFRFKAGNKYLLRLINMAALSPIQFSIDNHEFQVIAADGEPLQPSKPINSVVLNAAQRYDILVQAKGSSGVGKQDQKQNGKQGEVGSFWMRATGLHGLPWTRGTPAVAGEGYNYEGLAIVSYASESDEEPTSQQPLNMTTVSEFDFTPLVPAVLPSTPSDRTVLQFKMQNGSGYFAIDGGDFNHFTLPDDPPLYSIAAGLKTEELPVTTNARKINYGDHIEVVLVNVKDEQHPFHMHSHTPWVVGSGVASIDAIRNNTLPELRLVSPMKRDVYTIPPCTSDGNGGCLDAGYVVLRFNADNPGVWIMHCHIDWHLLAGLSMVFVEGEEQLQHKGLSAFSNSMLSVCGSRHFTNSTSNSTMS